MPALEPYIIEPIWERFEALLPERRANRHPLGCHRPRIPDRVVFAKLVEVLVFGCAYWRIADGSCSESALRRRRDEWIGLGLMERLREISPEDYDRLIGLELADLAVDGCVTRVPCGGEKAGRSPVDRGKGASNARRWWTRGASRLEPSSPRPTVTIRHCWRRPSAPWSRSGNCRIGRACIRSAPTTRKPLAANWRRAAWSANLREGQAGSAQGWKAVVRGAHELVAQRPQEAGVVYREAWSGDRLLGGLLRRGRHREATHPRRLEPLPLGEPASPTTMSY